MGLTDLSKDAQRVLEKTSPNSKYLKGAPVGLAKVLNTLKQSPKHPISMALHQMRRL